MFGFYFADSNSLVYRIPDIGGFHALPVTADGILEDFVADSYDTAEGTDLSGIPEEPPQEDAPGAPAGDPVDTSPESSAEDPAETLPEISSESSQAADYTQYYETIVQDLSALKTQQQNTMHTVLSLLCFVSLCAGILCASILTRYLKH